MNLLTEWNEMRYFIRYNTVLILFSIGIIRCKVLRDYYDIIRTILINADRLPDGLL